MSAPKRVQRKRTKGWRMPEGAVYVGRPTRWGNPWTVKELGGGNPMFVIKEFRDCVLPGPVADECAALVAVCNYRNELVALPDYRSGNRVQLTEADVRRELRGKDLACWCPLDAPCHADVLLEIANGVGR